MKNIVTQNRIFELNDPNITKREYDTVLKEIHGRVDYVWRELLRISCRKLKWYAFQNDVYSGGGDGSDGGYFNPETDGEFIELNGDYSASEFDGDFENGFPTRFLWTENDIWKQEVLDHIAQNKTRVKVEKEAKKKKADLEKISRAKAITSIKSKLTKEELEYVSFK